MEVFVFGSNLAGRHGKGAAFVAKQKHGAIRGIGEGIQGRSYGIPTKDHLLRSRTLPDIRKSVIRFLIFAYDNPHMIFNVSRVGCGLAGYVPSEIAPMFTDAPDNVILNPDFLRVLYP
jgi:hypothetical protein